MGMFKEEIIKKLTPIDLLPFNFLKNYKYHAGFTKAVFFVISVFQKRLNQLIINKKSFGKSCVGGNIRIYLKLPAIQNEHFSNH